MGCSQSTVTATKKTHGSRYGPSEVPAFDSAKVLSHAKKALAASKGDSRAAVEMRSIIRLLGSSKGAVGRGGSRMSYQDLNSEFGEAIDLSENAELDEWLSSTLGDRSSTRNLLPEDSMSWVSAQPLQDDSKLPGVQGSSDSLWVLPEAMTRALGEAPNTSPLEPRDESVQAMVASALVSWDYDVIAINDATCGHALLTLGLALLDHHALFDLTAFDRPTVSHFLTVVEAAYGDNPYHNSMHGADVAVGVHLFLTRFGLIDRLSPHELFGAILGAIVHDFNHPGTSNAHEARLVTERAITHSDQSVLERHHLHSTFRLLQHTSCDILAALAPEDRSVVRRTIIDMVLATDLSLHIEYTYSLTTCLSALHHPLM